MLISGQFSCQRPYHAEHTGSRPITEVKQRRASSVLGWVTAWEHGVLLASFFFRDFFQAMHFHGIKDFSMSYTLFAPPHIALACFWSHSFQCIVIRGLVQSAANGSWATKISPSLANGHITLNAPVLVRSLKLSNVEPR